MKQFIINKDDGIRSGSNISWNQVLSFNITEGVSLMKAPNLLL